MNSMACFSRWLILMSNPLERKFVISAPEHLQWVLLNSFAALPNQNLSLEVFDQPDSDGSHLRRSLTQEFDAMIDIVVPETIKYRQ